MENRMSDRSLAALTTFLDYLASKGLMAKNTAAGRKAACGKVLGVLDPEEQSDVLNIDLDDAMTRFINLEGRGYTPSSLNVYKSRVASALSDFASYLQNPAAFKPSTASKKSNGETTKRSGVSRSPKRPSVEADVQKRQEPPQGAPSANVFPIPIRADVVVRINGLPFDLTPAEAEKIASVVKAMAMATD
jgi:hypothetical protein